LGDGRHVARKTFAMSAVIMKEITLAGVTIPYAELGSGPPILVLHGAGGPTSAAPYMQGLARHGRVIEPIHPGFGNAELPDWIDSVDDLAYLYLDLLEQLDLRDVTLIGFSMGGWLAAEIATKSTARIARVILGDAVGIKISDRLTRDIADIFATAPDEMVRIAWHDVSKAPDLASLPDAALEIVARNREASALYLWEPFAHNPKLTHRLHRINVPVLVLWGRHDGIVKVDYGRAYADLIPGAVFEVIEDAGHIPQLETPELFLEHVTRFMGKR
jgi:pimeloyl-ACP methyl ester carboxylesterase